MNHQPLQAEEFGPMAHCFNEQYEANLVSVIRKLDNAIFLFHYLDEEEDIPSLFRRNTTHTLHHIKESLMQMYYERMGWKVIMRSKDATTLDPDRS